MGKNNAKETIDNAKDALLRYIQKEDRIYTILRSVSTSGMSRVISLYVIHEGEPIDVSWWTAKALGLAYDERRMGVKVRGCGMDMGFDLVHSLEWGLFEGSYSLKHSWL